MTSLNSLIPMLESYGSILIYWCPLNFFTSLKLRSVSSLGIRPFFVTFVFTTKPK